MATEESSGGLQTYTRAEEGFFEQWRIKPKAKARFDIQEKNA
ncbi:hypothetical protein [Sedimentisphaera cyanobacteriorum]|nr:hypothetical protein [Sedimentisphaera cyanobacteriorum]